MSESTSKSVSGSDAPLAQRLERLILTYSALGILFIGVIVALTSLLPLYERLKVAQEQHLLFAVKTRGQAVDQLLQSMKDVAAQITSRTKARQELERYNGGEISQEELERIISPILGDALGRSDDVVGIVRLDQRHRQAVAVGASIPEVHWVISGPEVRAPQLEGPVIIDGQRHLMASAPILDREDQRVGTDIVLFQVARLEGLLRDDGSDELKKTGRILLGTLDGGRLRYLFGGADNPIYEQHPAAFDQALRLCLTGEQGVLSEAAVVAYGVLAQAPWGVLVTMDQSELYAPVRGTLWRLAMVLVLLIGAGTLGMVLLLRPLAGRVIIHTDDLEREIREKTADLREARRIAEDANRAKSEFLANMSHEIRTPMNGIMGMAQLLLNTALSRQQGEYLSMINRSADTLLRILNDILDFSKIEAGKLDLEVIPFGLRDSLGDTLKLLATRASEKQLELAYHIPPEIPDGLLGDSGRLNQIMINLVGNSIKFTDHGEVVVSVKLKSSTDESVELHFEVRDTGIGIPSEHQGKLFKAFSQADASTTRKFGGTGLGLTISARLVEMMGGKIWLRSEPGQGSSFQFTAKFGLQTGDVVSRQLKGPESLKSLPVLVVDDNATNRMILDEMLRTWEMAPTTVASGPDAIASLRSATKADRSFELVLLDFMMPEMDGLQFCEHLRADPEIATPKLIMLSSADPSINASRARELGILRSLTKPIKQSELFDAIGDVMGVATRAAPPTKAAGTLTAVPEERSLKILLAEDGLVNQRVAQDLLTQRGHSVALARDGVEALAALEKEPFDLVLMDVNMPEMDGLEATRRIRIQEESEGADKHLRIIAMTANAMKGDRERCLDAGMDAYVSKPILAEELYRVVETVGASANPAPVEPKPVAIPQGEPAAEQAASSEGTAPARESPSGVEATATDANREETGDADDGAIIDREVALRHLGDDATIKDLVAIYFEETPRLMETIRRAVEGGDPVEVRRAAHTLKSSTDLFGAERAHRYALALETMGRNEAMETASEVFAHLEREVERVNEALRDEWGSGS